MEVLRLVLTREQRDSGLYLEEPDDHILELKRGEETLATFSQTGATVLSIREEADRHLPKGLISQGKTHGSE